MSMFSGTPNGEYDENGCWKRYKICFVSCGSRCNCLPPNGVYQLEGEELKRHKEMINKRREKLTEVVSELSKDLNSGG